MNDIRTVISQDNHCTCNWCGSLGRVAKITHPYMTQRIGNACITVNREEWLCRSCFRTLRACMIGVDFKED